MGRLEETKGRKEKRRLLAAFNKKQSVRWGSGAAFGSMAIQQDQLAVLDQEFDPTLAWNKNVNAYVDRELYEKALKTQDPTDKNYKGVSPNFGGGLQDPEKGIGSTRKNMNKLTTVLSKNQKLNSFNVHGITKKFETKTNLQNELYRHGIRQAQAAKTEFIE